MQSPGLVEWRCLERVRGAAVGQGLARCFESSRRSCAWNQAYKRPHKLGTSKSEINGNHRIIHDICDILWEFEYYIYIIIHTCVGKGPGSTTTPKATPEWSYAWSNWLALECAQFPATRPTCFCWLRPTRIGMLECDGGAVCQTASWNLGYLSENGRASSY